MRILIYHRKVYRLQERTHKRGTRDDMPNENDMRDEGTDLTTVLRAESDELPRDAAEISEEEMALMREYAGTEEDPMKALLRESREQTRLLFSINKYLFGIGILVGTLTVVGMTTMIIASLALR